MRSWVTLLCVVAMSLTLLGCGDSPEKKLEKAKVALKNREPDLAKNLAFDVIDAVGDGEMKTEAFQVLCYAQMHLVQLEAAKSTLDDLLAGDPDSEKGHDAQDLWVFLRLRTLLNQTDFLDNAKLQEEFDLARAMGNECANWYERSKGDRTRAEFIRGKLSEEDANRERRKLAGYRKSLESAQPTVGPVTPDARDPNKAQATSERSVVINDEKVQQFEARITAFLAVAETHYAAVLAAKPDHFEAVKNYVTLLGERKAWPELDKISKTVGAQKDIPADVSERLVLAVLQMPEEVQAKDKRLAACDMLQANTAEKSKRSKEWRLSESRILLAKEEPKKARDVLEEMLLKSPGDINGLYLLAQTYVAEKNYEKAKQTLDKLGSNPKAAYSVEINILRGFTLEALGETQLALEAFTRALLLDPSNMVARAARIRITVGKSGVQTAESDMRKIYEQDPINPRNIRIYMQYLQGEGKKEDLAKLLTEDVEKIKAPTEAHIGILIDGFNYLEQYDRAEEYARALIKARPLAVVGYLRLAETLLRQKREDDAIKVVADLQEKFPDTGSRNLILGQLYLQTQNFDEALNLLNLELKEKPQDLRTRMMVARTHASLARTQEALEQLDYILEQQPNNVDAHSLAARIYQFTGQQEQVRKHLSMLSEKDIDEGTNPALLVQLKILDNDLDKAAEIANRAVASGNLDPILRMMLANIYLKKKQPELAEDNLKALVERQKDNAQAYQLLARFYLQQNSERKGLEYFKSIQPQNEALCRLAQAMLHSGLKEYTEALDVLTRIYEPLIAKKDKLALGIADAMAKIHVAQDKYDQAEAVYQPLIEADHFAKEAQLRKIQLTKDKDPVEVHLKKLRDLAATLLPDDASLRRQVMMAIVDLKKHDDALALLNEWIEERPRDMTARRWKGELLIEIGRAAEAIPVFEDAANSNPEDKALRQRLALAYVASFNYPAAEKIYREMLTLEGTAPAEAMSELGRMYVTLGLNKQAVVIFNELEKIGQSHDPRIIYAMGQARAALGEDVRAMDRFREVPPFAPQYPRAQVRLAQLEIASGNAARARRRVEELAANPRSAGQVAPELLKLNIREESNLDLMRWADAQINLEALEDENQLNWLWARVTLQAEDKDWKGALTSLERIQQLAPDNDRALVSRMLVMWRLKKQEDARSLLLANGRISKTPVGPSIHVVLDAELPTSSERGGLAGYLEALTRGDVQAAEAAIQTIPPMRTLYKSDLRAVLERADIGSDNMKRTGKTLLAALVARELGLPQLTVELTDDALTRIPTLVPAFGLQAQAFLDLNQKDRRSRLTERLQKVGPSGLLMYVEMLDEIDKQNYDAAANTCRRLLELEADNYYVQYHLTQQLQLLKKYDEAIEVLREVSRRGGPFKLVAVNDLAYTVAEHQPAELEQAYALALKAYEVAPTNMPLLDTIGWIEHLRGHDAEALQHLSKAIIGLNELPEVHYHLGLVYRQVGNRTWAQYHLEQAAAGPADRREVQQAREQLSKGR